MLKNDMPRFITLNRLITFLTCTLKDVFFNPLTINSYVYHSFGRIKKHNWGDDINYYFLKYITERSISIYSSSSLSMRLKKCNYLCIGSTLNYLTTAETIVWGSGVISDELELPNIPKKVFAVRGPLTRKYLMERGVLCPPTYGDPALLIPYFYKPKHKKIYKIGIIPHYEDIDNVNVKRVMEELDAHLINIQNYNNWTDFIDEVCLCEHIFSSSLHGLIIAEAYGIPNTWIEVSNNIIGNHFKFHDFFLSINRDRIEPVIINDTSDLNSIKKNDTWKRGRIDLVQLLNSCPFKIKKRILYEHPLDIRSTIQS
jgi:pyruvyltransferase